ARVDLGGRSRSDRGSHRATGREAVASRRSHARLREAPRRLPNRRLPARESLPDGALVCSWSRLLFQNVPPRQQPGVSVGALPDCVAPHHRLALEAELRVKHFIRRITREDHQLHPPQAEPFVRQRKRSFQQAALSIPAPGLRQAHQRQASCVAHAVRVHLEPRRADNPAASAWQHALRNQNVRPSGGIAEAITEALFSHVRDFDRIQQRRLVGQQQEQLVLIIGALRANGNGRDLSHCYTHESGERGTVPRAPQLTPPRTLRQGAAESQTCATIVSDIDKQETQRMTSPTRISIPHTEISAFCQRWNVVEFALFGSVLRDDFTPKSDIDVLLTFAPGVVYTFKDLA